MKLLLALTCLLFFSLLNWNCTKIDTTTIGSSLIPAVDNVNVFDTSLAVISTNIDSTASDCAAIYPTSEQALGYISNDPFFGTTKATIYTQLEPPFYPYYWPATKANMSLDSIVLVLSYKRLYGDSIKQQKVDVHLITNTFTPDSTSCPSYAFNTAILGSKTYTPVRLQDSVKGKFDSTSYELRIPLSKTFGQQLLAQDSSAGSSLSSDSLFKNFLHGFAIVPDFAFGGNALTYYNLADSNTKLSIYYTYKRTGLADTSVLTNFSLTSLSKSANNIVRNHASADIAKSSSRPFVGDSLIYIQTTPGTYAEIRVPALSLLSNRVIYKASLIMDQVYTTDSLFTPPDYLFLDVRDTSANSYRPVPCDFNASSGTPDLTIFGGYRTIANDPFGHSISRYTFDISRYVQKIVTNKRTNSVMRLRAPDYIKTSISYYDECGLAVPVLFSALNELTVGRVRLGGGSNTNYKMHLRIIYSKL